jgi:uncharacterized protein (TIGR00255 family)
MILSMTGYGRGEAKKKSLVAVTEIRGVNNRFLEVSVRVPRVVSTREQELKDLTRKYLSRGKINITVTLDNGDSGAVPIKLNKSSAKAYYKLLNELRRTLRLRETVKLIHLLEFSDIFDVDASDSLEDEQWEVILSSVTQALDQFQSMRRNEGKELETDILQRLATIDSVVDTIGEKSKTRVPLERERLRERVKQLMQSGEYDEQRLELEIALLADKLDVTEECVRLRSHLKFFREAIASSEPGGRKLNFLIQEMHREINTIGSKSGDAEISRFVINMKEEIEKIREQIQNIE